MTRSPLSASVSSGASGAGERRSGACGSTISRSSPSTKRAASTLPARWLAARSGRAGVTRGSSGSIGASGSTIARDQQRIERARGLALATLRPARSTALVPGVDVAVEPGPGGGGETAQEHRSGNRAGEAPARDVVDVGDLRFEQLVVGLPQRHAPPPILLRRRP